MLGRDVAPEDHPLVGAETVAAIPSLAHLARLIRTHHERYDGTGFPAGLGDESLGLDQRIVSTCTALAPCEARMATNGGVEPEAALSALRHDGYDDPVLSSALLAASRNPDITGATPIRP